MYNRALLATQMVKYGVMQRCSALRDLLDWDRLYLSGRLHKPVLTLRVCPLVAEAQRRNVQSAVAVALLLLPQRFSWDALMHKLCSLSYRGALILSDESSLESVCEANAEVRPTLSQSECELDQCVYNCVCRRLATCIASSAAQVMCAWASQKMGARSAASWRAARRSCSACMIKLI